MMYTLKKLVPQEMKNIYHLLMALVANIRYSFPAREIPIVAVTGTDGKTTTVAMIAEIMRMAGKKVAVASTVEFCVGEDCEVNATKFTTLSSMKLQAFLRRAVHEKCDIVVLEVSSHSLDQNRVWGIRPEIAVLTNITREHLDYHGSMERYRKAKRKLFLMSKKHIINTGLEDHGSFVVCPHCTLLYGSQEIEKKNDAHKRLHLSKVKSDTKGVLFSVNNHEIFLPLSGVYNAENALAAIGVAREMNISWDDITIALKGFKQVPGRFEWIKNKKGFHILIDYAVTPWALENLYKTLGEIRKQGNIIAVFGSCGDRDRGKRPIMGEIVDQSADVIILTDEDPYWEDPKQILDEVEMGIQNKEKNKTLFRIHDRRKALKKAFSLAKKGDYIVITGKGAEETMMIQGKMIPWNDKQVVEEILKKI